MSIIGTHLLLYTTDAEALRKTLRKVFGFRSVDAGEGWLIFKVPPAELGVHPHNGPVPDDGLRHQISFMCDDIDATIKDLRGKGIVIKDDPTDAGWGVFTMMSLPGGAEVMLYEPRHKLAMAMDD